MSIQLTSVMKSC